jgi:hypothetical protein
MSNMEKTKHDRFKDLKMSTTIFVIWILSIAWFAVFFIRLSQNNCTKSETLGQFGDFFGGLVNPFCSLISLLLIARSLKYNSEALEVSMMAVKVAMNQVEISMKQFEFESAKHQKDFSDDESKSRRDLTISWHQNWMSPQMATLKRNAYGEIETRISSIERGQHSAFIGGFRTSDRVEVREKYYAIKDVMLLIHHAVTFFDDDLLDKDLFLKLFAADFRQWHSVLSRLDMRIGTFDGSQHSEALDAERQDLVERLARVIGL